MSQDVSQKQLLKARGICVIIPTYNNEKTIAHVINDALSYCDDVIVVNDGSTDATRDIVKKLSGFQLVSYDKNKGKGHALKVGFRKAIELGFSYAITMDADGQHYAKDIEVFLKANQEHPGALIIGERIMEGVVRSSGSDFANKFSNFWFYVQTGKNLKDTQTGYRLYPLKKLHGLSLLTSRYEAELELLVFSSWHGVELVSTPVNVFYPPMEERVTHFRPFWDFARISVLNTVLCALAIIYGLPMRIGRFLMKYVRTIYSLLFFLFFCMVIFTPLIWIYLKFEKNHERKEKYIHGFLCHASRFIMIHHGIPGVKFTYKKHPNTNFDKPAVIICNHQSHLDLMCQLIFTPKMIFLTNNWVWNNPLYGLIIRNAEFYPVASGIENIMPNLRSLAERGYSICVFPEGTRSKTCKIGRFHQGAFYIAEELGLDILPMCLYGPGKILPKRNYSLNKGSIHIEVGERISPSEMAQHGDTKQQASFMKKRYEEWYSNLCNKIEQDA